jgi:hypothetical protein
MRKFCEERLCSFHKCRLPFTATKRDVIYCSATCGRHARGLDSLGRIVKWWLPQYRRSA